MGYNDEVTRPKDSPVPFQPYLERLNDALNLINDKTKPFQTVLNGDEKVSSAQTEFESRLEELIEKADKLARSLRF